MAVAADEWLRLIEREYIADFATQGGSAVKFVIGDNEQLASVGRRLSALSEAHGLAHVALDAAETKIHMIQDVFFAMAAGLDWEAMAQRFAESLFTENLYHWPRPGQAVPIDELAKHNGVDLSLARLNLDRWLTDKLMRDTEMAQDFRLAMMRLGLRRLEPEDARSDDAVPVLQWLLGRLRHVGRLKGTAISGKITRHNARAMLRSLCRWVRLCGRRGVCVVLDIRQLAKSGVAAAGGAKYSSAAVMDAFEVLRQIIDDAEHFAGFFLVVMGDEALIGDDRRRSLNAYQALKMRVWNDVRPEGRDNPLAPLVRLATPLHAWTDRPASP